MSHRHFLAAGASSLFGLQMLLGSKKNECGGILAYVTTQESNDAKSLVSQHAPVLQNTPYQQCGVAFKTPEGITTAKFTTKSGDELSSDIKDVHPDEYMLKTRPISNLPEDDCFYKLQGYLQQQSAKSTMCVVSSRYASSKGAITEE